MDFAAKIRTAGLFRLTALAVVAILLWLTVATGIATLARTASPSFALSWWPLDPQAKANLAEQHFTGREDRAGLAEREALARQALERDLTVIKALRMIGLVATAREQLARADAIFQSSNQLSKRDLPSQIWLIERNVRRDDVPAVLRHFYNALSTSRSSHELLFPILVAASAKDELVRPISDMIVKKPEWGETLSLAIIRQGPSTPHVLEFVKALKARRYPVSPAMTQSLVSRLAGEKRFADAYRIFEDAPDAIPLSGKNLVRDGHFDRVGQFQPFDWTLASAETFGSARQTSKGGASTLSFYAEQGRAAELAYQVLMLPAGNYRLSADAADVQPASGEVFWLVACADDSNTTYLRLAVAGSQRTAGEFRMPAICPAALLSLRYMPDGREGSEVSGWINEVVVARIR